ncbi:C39 family peptidase [Dictyobacter arantiisoli]|uniref:Peptidase C39-like domain-containing protein n=1 Tax=Dictyobacter arantiisoli TaxID=2014874 RepID=A0A5A5T7I8_9CHLR|nr:C39 family peptidase [Dictyobacter arantiisoli]GCF07441.1 hypothetical protein KDI_10050 [Dictyobacter arantiisoli]
MTCLFSRQHHSSAWRVTSGCLVILTLLFIHMYTQPSPVHMHASASQQYDEFWQQQSRQDFQRWFLNGVQVQNWGTHVNVQLEPANKLNCSVTDIDGGEASYARLVRLCAGRDPYKAHMYHGKLNYYNGGSFYFGTLVSPVHIPKRPVTALIASWNASTPVGTWLEIHIRVRRDVNWTHWYALPIWASSNQTITRHSIAGQDDATGNVDTDTFRTRGKPATAYQFSMTLFSTTASISAHLKRFSAIASYDTDGDHIPVIRADRAAWGSQLAVPQRSQMLPAYRGLGFGGGGEAWCSPTSTSMVMDYWSTILKSPALNQTVPYTARSTYDYTYEGTGNWPFNTAHAGSYGLKSFVTRMYSLSQIEPWIKAGVPIIISIAYGRGELLNSPIPSSDGHLLVIRGFTRTGDVITNDPAAANNVDVQIIYWRANLQHVWLAASAGTAYIIYPENWIIPTVNRLASW